MKLYIHHLTIKSLLVKTMPCWAAHTLYQLMTFKVMHTPLLPPLGFHYTCQVMHKVLICYNFFCFLHFQISGIDHSNVMFHLGSGGGLLVTCFFYPLGTVNYIHPASRGFFPAWLLAFVKSFQGGTSGNSWGGGVPPSSPSPDQVFQTKKCHFHTCLRPYVGTKCVMFTSIRLPKKKIS